MTHTDTSDPVLHYRKPDSREFLCNADQGFTTTYAPNVTCPECLEWLPRHCGRGPCAAMDGHEGTCAEASGWAGWWCNYCDDMTDHLSSDHPFHGISPEHVIVRDGIDTVCEHCRTVWPCHTVLEAAEAARHDAPVVGAPMTTPSEVSGAPLLDALEDASREMRRRESLASVMSQRLTTEELERIYSPIGNEDAYPELPGIIAEIIAERTAELRRTDKDEVAHMPQLTAAEREELAEAALREHEPGFANVQGSRLRDTLLGQFREVVDAQAPIIERIILERQDAVAVWWQQFHQRRREEIAAGGNLWQVEGVCTENPPVAHDKRTS